MKIKLFNCTIVKNRETIYSIFESHFFGIHRYRIRNSVEFYSTKVWKIRLAEVFLPLLRITSRQQI